MNKILFTIMIAVKLNIQNTDKSLFLYRINWQKKTPYMSTILILNSRKRSTLPQHKPISQGQRTYPALPQVLRRFITVDGKMMTVWFTSHLSLMSAVRWGDLYIPGRRKQTTAHFAWFKPRCLPLTQTQTIEIMLVRDLGSRISINTKVFKNDRASYETFRWTVCKIMFLSRKWELSPAKNSYSIYIYIYLSILFMTNYLLLKSFTNAQIIIFILRFLLSNTKISSSFGHI